jgi:hypothetical protein
VVRIYLDYCCFNRPYDDQSSERVRKETEAKLRIQEAVREKNIELVWSYILEYENSKNPYLERRSQISQWRKRASIDISATVQVLERARGFQELGIKNVDSLHVSSAVEGVASHFLTTDDTILKRANRIDDIEIVDPVRFSDEVMS